MRTALYVFKTTTITIDPMANRPDQIHLFAHNAAWTPPPLAGAIALPPGIYQIKSDKPVRVTVQNLAFETSLTDKEEWPDPPTVVLALEKGATPSTVKEFFAVNKSLEF
jgi:hypothetical protein